MHLELIQSTSVANTEIVSSQLIDKLYRLSYEDLDRGITSVLDGSSRVEGRLQASAAYEDAVRYLAGIDPGDVKRFLDLYITIPNNNYYIRFEDSNVESICASNWGDGIGITKLNALSTATIGLVFKLNTTIRKFNELKYFGITYLDNNAFEGCTSLKEVTLSPTVGTLGHGCFQYANNLETINVENVISIGSSVFNGSDNITTKLKNGDVFWFKSLTTFTGYSVFGNCNIAQIYLPKLAASYNQCTFKNNWSARPLFGGGRNHTFTCGILYLKDISKIYTGTFCTLNCSALVINNTTPPVWANYKDETDGEASGTEHDKNRMFESSNIGGQGLKIVYVPDSAIATYQADSMWGSLCTFRGISELNNGVIYRTYEDWINASKPTGLIAEYLGLNTEDLAAFVTTHNLTYWTAT